MRQADGPVLFSHAEAHEEKCFFRIRDGVSCRHLMTIGAGTPLLLRLICLVLCSPLAIPAFCWAKSDLDRFELVGAVRTVVTKHPQLKTTHQFDRNERLTHLELSSANETGAVRYVFTHDAEGRLIEEQTFEPDGTTAYKKVFRYVVDDQGRQTAEVAATETGGLAHAEFAFYDERGLLAEDLTITGQDVVEKSLYDVRGNLVYHARYFQGHLVLEATHHHGPLGRLKESRFYSSDGELMRKDLFRYDHAGHRVEQTSEFYRHSHLRKSVTTYEFDQVGNWTKETVQRWSDKNGTVVMTETMVSQERTITYYTQ